MTTIPVVGAGIAGLSAALELTRRGETVTVLERRAFLGGRATSFLDRVTQDRIDNAQHVLLGCCTNVLALLDEVGTRDRVRWYDRFHYFDGAGARHDLARGILPAPLHFGPALLGWTALGPGERLEIARAFAVLMLSSRSRLERWRDRPIIDWLRARGQSERALARFWRPIIVSAVNEELDRAATLPSLQVFVEGFLPHRDAPLLGVPTLGLEELIAQPAAARLKERGSEVASRSFVVGIEVEGRKLRALVLADGSRIVCRSAVLAIPAEALAGIAISDGAPLLPGPAFPPSGHSPIVGLHLWFDREVMDLEHAALLDARLEWVFAHAPGEAARALGAVQRIQGVFSAGRDLVARSRDDIVAASLRELSRVFPAAAEARLLHATVVKENRATMLLDPATDAARPMASTRIEGLVLAGDWTRSGWPATLEGACRSGKLAAAALLGLEAETALVPDLARGPLARMLMARCPKRLEPPA